MTATATPTSGQARINSKRAQRAQYWHSFPGTTIWDGNSRDWGSQHQTRVMDWLSANGIVPTYVLATAPITVHDGKVSFTLVRLNDEGRPYADADGNPAVESCVMPLLVPFETPETTR